MKRTRSSSILIVLAGALWCGRAAAAAQGLLPEVEPNGIPATATPLVSGDTVVVGNIFPAGDVDYWSFTGSGGDRVYAAVQTSFNAQGAGDSDLSLLAIDGVSVLEIDLDDGSLGNNSSSIAGTVLPGSGTYYLKVTHHSVSGQLRPYYLHFRLQTGASPPFEVEPNDSAALAEPLSPSGWVSGMHFGASDQDWYSFAAGAGDTVFASLDLDPERDSGDFAGRLRVGFLGSAGDQLVTVDDAGATAPDSEAIFLTLKNAGIYFVVVDGTFGTGTYHLSVSVHPATAIGVSCQTYASGAVNLPIGPDPGVTDSVIVVPGHPRIEDVNVTATLTHAAMPDLDAALISPSGNENSLFTDIGNTAQTQMDTDFDDEAGIPPVFTVMKGIGYQPEFAYRLSWFKGEDAGGGWTLRLRDDTTGNSGTLSSWALTVCEPPAPPACNGTPVTVYASDFEGGADGFTHAGVLDEWSRGLPASAPIASCSSGTNCWKTDLTGTYEASSNQDLLSPLLNLGGLAAPIQLTWAQKYQMDSASSDAMSVEVRDQPATQVRTLFQWLDGAMTDNVGNPVVALQESAGWGLVHRGIDDFAGRVVQLRWNVTSDAVTQLAGLAVDDVVLTACCTAASCDDGNTCTTDTCDAQAGCVHSPVSAPAEVTGLSFPSGKNTIAWSAAPLATRYDVLRGSLAALPVGPGGGDEICFDDDPNLSITDAQTPATGGFWYLVRGENACAAPGTYGSASGGAPRTSTTCPTSVSVAPPTVTTSAATLVTPSSATLNGSANPNGDPTTGWFRYGTQSPGTCNDVFGTRAPVTGGSSLGAGTTAIAFATPTSGLGAGTTYYACAIASNALGTSFGAVVSFTTSSSGPPTVTTSAATSLTVSSAALNASANPNGDATTGWFRYSTTDPGTCDDTFGTRAPVTGGSSLGAGTTEVAFSTPISGLVAGTTYYVCGIASNGLGNSFGAVVSFATPFGPPTVTTSAATSLTVTSATLNGSANPNGNSATGWFRYSTTDPGICDDTFGTRAPVTGGSSLGAGTTEVAFTTPISGLVAGTTYYVCAIASNAQGTSFGTVVSFTTPAGGPTVTTSAATSLTSTSAALNGSANANGDATTGWFRYSTTSPGTCNDTFGTRAPTSGGSSLGAGTSAVGYTRAISGLVAGTTYYVCAIASNAQGTSFGSVVSFTTLAGAPTVTTSAATLVTSSSATLNGSANPHGDATTGWFRYGTANPGVCNDVFGVRAPLAGGSSLGAGTTAVAFSTSISGLSAGTTYYVCAVASNAVATSFGAVVSFTTP